MPTSSDHPHPPHERIGQEAIGSPDPGAAHPSPDPITVTDHVLRPGQVLAALTDRRVELDEVTITPSGTGSRLLFADGTRLRVDVERAEDLAQLAAAARLVPTYLALHTRASPDGQGRLLVFTAAHWTLYVPTTRVATQ